MARQGRVRKTYCRADGKKDTFLVRKRETDKIKAPTGDRKGAKEREVTVTSDGGFVGHDYLLSCSYTTGKERERERQRQRVRGEV